MIFLRQYPSQYQELTRDRQEFQQIETDLTHTMMRAPITGTIQQLNLRNTDQLVQPGELIAQIAPSSVPSQIPLTLLRN